MMIKKNRRRDACERRSETQGKSRRQRQRPRLRLSSSHLLWCLVSICTCWCCCPSLQVTSFSLSSRQSTCTTGRRSLTATTTTTASRFILNNSPSNNNNNNDESTDSAPSLPSHGYYDVQLGTLEGTQDEELVQDQTAFAQRQATVNALVAEQEQDAKHERKRRLWGDALANATTVDQVQHELSAQQQQQQQAWKQQAVWAQHQGVSLDVLESTDDTGTDDAESTIPDDGVVWDPSEDMILMPGSAAAVPSTLTAGWGGTSRSANHQWYEQVDQELQEEWNSLLSAGSGSSTTTTTSSPTRTNAPRVPNQLLQAASGIQSTKKAGIRVGSAGSWMLEIFPGDFVVHRKYGIGRFEKTCLRPKTKLTDTESQAQSERRAQLLRERLQEIQTSTGNPTVSDDVVQDIRTTFGTAADTDPVSNPQVTVLEISYSDVMVHVPVDKAYRLSRYRAGDAVVKPKLSRARGQAWGRAKQKVQENTLAMAQDVLVLYARRETLSRPPADPSQESLVQTLEETFPYTPTPDQHKCFEDVENDMVWRKRPMDRLVCGDVGFGKTEVALRALYRCVKNGRQAALLAPTGVLAAQHFKNVLARMGPETPFNVTAGLLRGGLGKTSSAGREMRASIENNEIQLIVGTHALLSKDLKYGNLGLLVIDEEQRFGVKQKERLKLICDGIDVLTLSATPIPRTLQMSLSGIRDTSTIKSPPPLRKPVITYVQEYSDSMIQKAIEDELARGGQCYYVVPRISMIEEAEQAMLRLFPDLRIIQAHGRMKRNGAEDNVASFAEGNYDVLLATTVIENGVDIPSVNTIIIQNSQAFGMSTLYQLRGRVGRSDRQAYAYFLHQDTITEQGVLRLNAISELNELGSGFDIANRDLEIRGAGSLLGTEQSGLAAKVGFDLYMRMLKKSVRKLRGLDLPVVPRTNVLLPIDGSPGSFRIPPSFIPDEKERQTAESSARLADSTAGLIALTNKWKEERGALPAEIQGQLKGLHLHVCTRRLGIDLVGMDSNSNCILRSPALRPRHWAIILDRLPRKASPKGLDAVFPARFSLKGETIKINSGDKLDLRQLLEDESLSEDREDEDWEAIDQEEAEAMNDIHSAVKVKDLAEVDVDHYPRLVVKNFGVRSNSVDLLLQMLLPIAKIVGDVETMQVENAKTAAALREKEQNIRHQQKVRAKQAEDKLRLMFD